LLELDLVLARFLETGFEHLDDEQVADFEDLLRCDDYDLWAMINGGKACETGRWQEIVARLRQC
jgi:antitoxin CptB